MMIAREPAVTERPRGCAEDMCEKARRWVHRVTRPVDSKGPQREESATFMGRIVGLVMLGLALAMVGFASSALFWLGIAGLMLFVATGFVGAMHPALHPAEQRVGDGPMSSQPGRVRLGRRGGSHRAS